MTPATSDFHPAKGASLIALLAGLWFFISPWILGVSSSSWPKLCRKLVIDAVS